MHCKHFFDSTETLIYPRRHLKKHKYNITLYNRYFIILFTVREFVIYKSAVWKFRVGNPSRKDREETMHVADKHPRRRWMDNTVLRTVCTSSVRVHFNNGIQRGLQLRSDVFLHRRNNRAETKRSNGIADKYSGHVRSVVDIRSGFHVALEDRCTGERMLPYNLHLPYRYRS